MRRLLKAKIYLFVLLSIVPFLRPEDRSATVLLWPFKLLAGALAPILGLVSGLGALWGLARRDWKLAGAGVLGAGLAARFLADIPPSQGQFEAAFGPDWQQRVPASLRPQARPRRWSLLSRPPRTAAWQRDVVYGQTARSAAPLLADLWQPPPGVPRTGLVAIFIHGGGWRIGAKDLGTRAFFRWLVGQGHVVLDVNYTLWPEGDIPTMLSEVKQAILWLKENAGAYDVDPQRIVLMGGSAGGHLALLAAYTPNHPAFQPSPGAGDTSVRGVVAFYPPTDFTTLHAQVRDGERRSPAPLKKAANAMLNTIFAVPGENSGTEEGSAEGDAHDLLPAVLGGRPDEIPETYRLLSPRSHVGAHCPPTLLLQGSDDVFALPPTVRSLFRDLQNAGIPSILVEFPHADHAFDLVLPQVSPVAQAAICDVARFLALLV